MKDPILVSIITVVYNGEKHIQQTIDSVYSQTYKNIEYIIIDGGSKDGTIDIIKNNENKISYWITEADNGLYDAMNKGIRVASGELIGTINSDDWYELDAIQSIVESYQKNPNKKIFHGSRYDIMPDGEKIEYRFHKSSFRFKYFAMTYSHPAMFVSKDVYKLISYNTGLKLYSDYQFVLTSYLENPNQFFYIDKFLVNFRLGGISSNANFFSELKEGFIARRNAKMTIIESAFAYILILLVRPLINIFKAIRKWT